VRSLAGVCAVACRSVCNVSQRPAVSLTSGQLLRSVSRPESLPSGTLLVRGRERVESLFLSRVSRFHRVSVYGHCGRYEGVSGDIGWSSDYTALLQPILVSRAMHTPPAMSYAVSLHCAMHPPPAISQSPLH
jgi:hypothetical protein